jgi:hypothetical protein
MVDGRSMRAMETTPAAWLDIEDQGNYSFNVYSWGPSQATYCEGEGR